MTTNKKINFNIGEFTWFILLLAISFYFYKLVSSGNVTMFISPSMSKYVLFASIALLILGIFQLPKIINTPNGKAKFGYLIFAIPIIIGILVDPVGLNQQIADAKGVNVVQNTSQTNAKAIKENSTITKNNEIILNEKNFFTYVNGINDDPNKFKDYRITLTGFVYKDDSIKHNQFVIARMLMVYCAADTQIIGFLCNYDGQNLDKDTWVQITGVLDTTNYTDSSSKENFLIPLIKVQSIKKVNPPASKYVYINNTD
ncbi:TIGR03943 family putative permease subunit [Clostridium magnum]|uniref:Putative two-component membrane permease complex subunit n=1 Tax=Clostridium magnum DSM 2767 TaxID=1121326 RepID=A0A168DSX5_9CLOT|nr:TIGR03943 family protein [Clostridium magnum]KZL91440.1 putative two-component membrane permease complex subunit [Clostridium magnum DSM 2767]SHH42407.1 putative membrane protein [Clostridium magnum DSM 2767]